MLILKAKGVIKMKENNIYKVSLINHQGCNFDNGKFTSLRKARQWASGRGMTSEFGNWYKYTVVINKNDEDFLEYKTK
jgi:hypothetical protein